MYRKVFIPLMNINSHVYAFLSGILISLSTGIFVALCFEPLNLSEQWHLFLATILITISGGICMMVSAKVSGFQAYNTKHSHDKDKCYRTILDVTKTEKKKWISYYIFLTLTFIAGNMMLALNWIIEYSIQYYC